MHVLELGNCTAITITIFNCDIIMIVRSTCTGGILFVRISRASYTVYKVHPISMKYEIETVDKNIDDVNNE